LSIIYNFYVQDRRHRDVERRRRSGWDETAGDAVVRRTPSHHNRGLINDINLMYKGQQLLPAVNHLLCWCFNVRGRRWGLGEFQLFDSGFHRRAERKLLLLPHCRKPRRWNKLTLGTDDGITLRRCVIHIVITTEADALGLLLLFHLGRTDLII
jgi:hypothetical protein